MLRHALRLGSARVVACPRLRNDDSAAKAEEEARDREVSFLVVGKRGERRRKLSLKRAYGLYRWQNSETHPPSSNQRRGIVVDSVFLFHRGGRWWLSASAVIHLDCNGPFVGYEEMWYGC